MKNYVLGILMVLVVWSGDAIAACSNPSGIAGDQMYNSTHSVMQYCDGTDWTAMGGGGSGSGSGSGYFACSNEASDGDGIDDIADCVLATTQHIQNATGPTPMPTIIPVGCRRPGDNKFTFSTYIAWYAPTQLWYVWGTGWHICNDGTQLFDKSTVTTTLGCHAGNVTWSNCVASVAAASGGYSQVVNDTTNACGNWAGSTTATCNSEGVWSTSGGTCSYTGSCGGGGEIVSCFIAGTMVTLGDGSERAIEEIKAGDIVLGMDGARNKVTGVEVPPIGGRVLYAFNGGNFFVTEEHPFRLTSGQWASIRPVATLEEQPQFEIDNGKLKFLEIGDELVMKNGQTMVIEKIESRGRHARTMPVYNLLLDGNHTYYADGFLVHNKM